MSFTVVLERQAEKELRNLPPQILRRIDKRILSLASDPWPRGVTKLKGKESEGFRIKTGDYRILYIVDNKRKIVQVYRIKHRSEAYR